jgi:topoisomerase IA-like protein
MAKYSKKSQKTVESAMHRKKKGTLRSGRSGKKVTSRKQAIAIGLSEAREKGAKVPPPKKKSAKKKSAGKKTAKKSTAKKSGAKKTASKKSTSRKTSRKKKAS